MAPSHSCPSAAWWRDWFVWFGVLALAGYAVLLGVNSTVAAGGSDASGYLNTAQMLMSGRLETPMRLPPGFDRTTVELGYQFQPLGFHTFEDQFRMVPTYPTGLPLHLALAGKIFGWPLGIRIVVLAGALGAIWLCYAVGRELGLNRWLASAGAVTLAACPLMLLSSLQPLSDGLAATWCLAAVWAGLRARRQLGWAAACGAAYGMAVLVRPTNLSLLPALVVLLGWDWRRLLGGALGGIPAAAWLAYYNRALYGGALESGYINWWEFFAPEYIRPAALFFVRWLVVFIPAVLLVLPLAAVWRKDLRTRELLALAWWFFGITGIYLFCAFSHEAWNSLRYLLPGIPALILGGLLGIEAIARALPPPGGTRLRRIAGAVIAVWAVGASWRWSPAHAVFWVKRYEDAYIVAPAAARARFPENTLLLCCYASGAIYHYTRFPLLRYDNVNPAHFARYAALARRAGFTVGALLYPQEEKQALHDNCPGDWTLLDTVDGVHLWRLVSAASPAAETPDAPARQGAMR